MDERRAIERLKGGDIGGLETLAGLHYTRATRVAYLIVRDRDLAEDVTQGALIRAYESIGSFDAGRPFGPWFMKIVVNDAIKMASRRERAVSFYAGDKETLLDRLVDPGTSPQESAEKAETSRRVWLALEQLPPAQRAVVVQRYYLGMSEAEMVGPSASSLGTIKSRLNRARKRLSQLLRLEFRKEEDSPKGQEQPVAIGVLPRPSERRRDHE